MRSLPTLLRWQESTAKEHHKFSGCVALRKVAECRAPLFAEWKKWHLQCSFATSKVRGVQTKLCIPPMRISPLLFTLLFESFSIAVLLIDGECLIKKKKTREENFTVALVWETYNWTQEAGLWSEPAVGWQDVLFCGPLFEGLLDNSPLFKRVIWPNSTLKIKSPKMGEYWGCKPAVRTWKPEWVRAQVTWDASGQATSWTFILISLQCN